MKEDFIKVNNYKYSPNNTTNIRQIEHIEKIISYIHEHYNEKITADDIAKYAEISRVECFRCIKRFTKKRLVEYINEYRLKKALLLLCETKKNVIQISAECGFESTSYFGKLTVHSRH